MEGVTHIIASLKTISEDGSFEIRNLMRGNDALPTAKLRAVIDRELFHRTPGRIPSADVIEFSYGSAASRFGAPALAAGAFTSFA